MIESIFGIRVIISNHLYKTKFVLRGLPDSRRPNGGRLFYRKVLIKIPEMYRLGNDIICHPYIAKTLMEVSDGGLVGEDKT